MILFPAIDLYGGRVVRLTEGDFARKTDYGLLPVDAAKRFLDGGCRYIHIVDLEGAELGCPCHLDILEQIKGLGMFVQYGGGLRSETCVRDALSSGADRVMIGSLLFMDPDMPKKIISEFGKAVMPAIDVRGRRVVHSGWLEETGLSPDEVIKSMHGIGFSVFLVTDTGRDGLMGGTSAEFYKPFLGKGYDIVAAGGITTAKDISALALAGVSGAVVGKSLYEGGIRLADALEAAKCRRGQNG